MTQKIEANELPKYIVDANDIRYRRVFEKATEVKKGFYVRYVSDNDVEFTSIYGISEEETIQRARVEIFSLPITEIKVSLDGSLEKDSSMLD
jgi:hypothetical protein